MTVNQPRPRRWFSIQPARHALPLTALRLEISRSPLAVRGNASERRRKMAAIMSGLSESGWFVLFQWHSDAEDTWVAARWRTLPTRGPQRRSR